MTTEQQAALNLFEVAMSALPAAEKMAENSENAAAGGELLMLILQLLKELLPIILEIFTK